MCRTRVLYPHFCLERLKLFLAGLTRTYQSLNMDSETSPSTESGMLHPKTRIKKIYSPEIQKFHTECADPKSQCQILLPNSGSLLPLPACEFVGHGGEPGGAGLRGDEAVPGVVHHRPNIHGHICVKPPLPAHRIVLTVIFFIEE